MLEWKKKKFRNPWKISYKMYKIFFPFSIENEKTDPPPLPSILGGF